MKKTLAMLCSAALCASLLAGCSGGASQTPAPQTAAPGTSAPQENGAAALTGSVSTNGSTSMEKVMGILIEAFREDQPGVTVTYDPTGSGSGVEAAGSGRADIGLSSRALKEEEISAGVTETVVARDGIAIVVNPANSAADLSVEQIAQIARGEITDWSEVGGTGGQIAFIGREAGSGTRGAFEEVTGTADACRYTQELTSTGAVLTAVATTPGAIGYASLSAVDDTVKALTVEGVACTEETILDGSYAMQRPFVFATRAGEPLSAAAQAFYDFALSPDQAQLYVDAGVVPAVR